MARPTKKEFPEYYKNYIDSIQGDDLIKALKKSNAETRKLFKNVSNKKGTYTYAEGKWTLNELVQHMIDTERIFAYRMLRISRNDKTPLPGFEQNDFVPNCNIKGKKLSDLLIELSILRNSTLLLAKGFSDDMLKRQGTASGWTISVRAIGFCIAGHELHHLKVIKERYL